MATAITGKARCITCGKDRSAYYCRGCSNDFCFNHLVEHRRALSQQLDEIENDRDYLQQTLIEQKENQNKHVLLQAISKWEEDSIHKIKETAKECKQRLAEHTNNCVIDLEKKLTKLTEQMRETRQEDEFNEIDLNELKSKLTKLTEEFVKPPNIVIQQDSTSFIHKISVVMSSENNNIDFKNSASNERVLTMAQVQQLAEDRNKCIIVINNRVYDVTKFIDEHPGGENVLEEQHGKDASNAFEDVGHSSDACEQMKTYEIARLVR